MMRLSRFRMLAFAALIGFGMIPMIGCKREGIRTYEVPRDKQRLLAAIIPAEESTWFFKLMGQTNHVNDNAATFWAFIRTVRIQDAGAEPIVWTVPESWKYEPGKDLRYATFRIPHGQEVTVFRFGTEGNKILENVNRWRGQLKLPPIGGNELLGLCKEEMIGDRRFLLVDMESARTDAVPQDLPSDKPATNVPAPKGEPEKDLSYDTPPGWTATKSPSGMRRASFQIEEGAKKVEVSVIPLSGPAGGLASNVNRWRKEVGLADAAETEIVASAKKIDMAAVESVYVDLIGPKGRTLGVICPRGGQTWFVKMWGPDEVIGKQKLNFETFVRSIRFGGGN